MPRSLVWYRKVGLTILFRIADAKNIILMGVGDAFVGILYLLANRGNVLSDGYYISSSLS